MGSSPTGAGVSASGAGVGTGARSEGIPSVQGQGMRRWRTGRDCLRVRYEVEHRCNRTNPRPNGSRTLPLTSQRHFASSLVRDWLVRIVYGNTENPTLPSTLPIPRNPKPHRM